MDKREFFENIVNHFLFVSKNEGNESGLGYPGYTLLSLKLKDDSFGLDINVSEKLALDKINTLKHPVIEDLKEIDEYSVLPPSEVWSSLSLKSSKGLESINYGLTDLIKTEIPVIELSDFKSALKSGNLELPLKLCKVDIGLSTELKQLRQILLKKLAVYSKEQFYTDVVKNFLVMKKEGSNYNLYSLNYDSKFNEILNESEMSFLRKFNSDEKTPSLAVGFDPHITNTFILPPMGEWKSLTLERTGRKQSLFKGISALVGLGHPVVFYDNLVDGIKSGSFKLPVHSFSVNRLSPGHKDTDELKIFMMNKFGVKSDDYKKLRKSSMALELEPVNEPDFNQVKPRVNSTTSREQLERFRSKKKKPFWKFW